MSEQDEAEYKDLVHQYDELRKKELDFISKRHASDQELQKMRFEIKRIASKIARTFVGGDMPCW